MDREGVHRVEQGMLPGLDMLTTHVEPPRGRKYWLTDEMLPRTRLGEVKPSFKIAEVAKIFFARSADWLRWLGAQQDKDGGVLELDGVPLEIQRTTAGSRTYTLVDVERLAHALLENHKIDGMQYVTAINLIRWMALNYKILSEQDMMPTRSARTSEQLVIPDIDKSLKAAGHKPVVSSVCSPCRSDDHGDCELACELSFKSPGAEIEAACSCFRADPAKHGAKTK
jgi:hypothetical protein